VKLKPRDKNPPAESEGTLKRTITLAGFSLLELSASEFIPRLLAEIS